MAYCAISMVLTRMISWYGAEAVATQRVGGQIESISWNTADGFAAALNALSHRTMVRAKMTVSKKDIRLLCGRLVSGDCWSQLYLYVFRNRLPESFSWTQSNRNISWISDHHRFQWSFYVCGTDDSRCIIRARQNPTLQYHQYSFYQCKNSAVDHSWRYYGSGWNMVAISSTSIVKGIIFTCTFLWLTRKRPSQT